MSKKFLAVLLVVCMVVSAAPMAFAVEFTDTDDHWAESSIARWAEYKIVEGYDGAFDPEGNMTRGQAAAVFARLLKLETKADISKYTDVDPNEWYAEYIALCVAAGIMNGVGDDAMDPNGTLTREQMMTMLCRALGIEPEETCDKEFTDSDEISDWAEGYMNALVNAGIVNGISEDSLAPTLDINRASVMALLDKGIAAYADEEGETVSVDDDATGVVLIVANDVTVEDAPVGTIVVTGADASGATVNGTEIEKDTVIEVEEEEPVVTPTPAPVIPEIPVHYHSYTYVTNNDGTHKKICCGTANEACSYNAQGVCTYCEFAAEAKIGSTYYVTLAEAIAADGEIVLLKDVDLGHTPGGDDVLLAIGEIIDLNGKILKGNVLATLKVNGGKFVTPEGHDQIVPATGSYDANDYYVSDDIVVTMGVGMVNMQLIMESGTVELAQDGYTLTGQDLVVKNGATFKVSDGMFFWVKNGTTATVEAGGNLVLGEGSVIKLEAGAKLVGVADTLNVDGVDADVDVVYDDATDTFTGYDMAGKVARIGTDYYATLTDALAAAQTGDTVTMLKDVTASAIVTIDEAITLDGNGKTLTSTAARAINVDVNGEVTVKNLTIVAPTVERGFNIINKPATLTIEDVTATAGNYTVNVAASAAGARVAITESTFTGLNTINVAASGAEVTITDSVINCVDDTPAADSEYYTALHINKDGAGASIAAIRCTFNIAGNSVNAGVIPADADITIDGGHEGVEYMLAYISPLGNDSYYTGPSLANLLTKTKSGDTVVLVRDVVLTETLVVPAGVTIELNGNEITAAAGYVLSVEGNTYTISAAAALIGEEYYATLADAIAAATDGQTVEVLAETIDEAILLNITQDITINGNGATMTAGMWLGTDVYNILGAENHNSVTVTGFKFEGYGLVISDIKEVTVTDNIFTDIDSSPECVYDVLEQNNAIWIEHADTVIVSDNSIDGTSGGDGGGIVVSNTVVEATITGNTVKNTNHNSAQVSTSRAGVVAVVTGNTFENWGLGGEGRAFRSDAADVTYTGNVMKHSGAIPEQFVKLDPVTTFDVDGNYWNDESPADADIFWGYSYSGINDYYADEAMTVLRSVPIWS